MNKIIQLTKAQEARLAVLEEDETAKVVGHFDELPIIEHMSRDRGTKHMRETLALLQTSGRLTRLGATQAFLANLPARVSS